MKIQWTSKKKKLKDLHERERKALIAVTSEANIESQRLFRELNGPVHLALGSPGIDGPKGITPSSYGVKGPDAIEPY